MGVFNQSGSNQRGAVGDFMNQAWGRVEANAPTLLRQVLGETDVGSIGGLLTKLQQAGLGDKVASWLGNGSNLPITAEQLRDALGDEHVQQIANSLGLPTDKILDMLSQHLPAAVDKMSPNGTLEEPAAD